MANFTPTKKQVSDFNNGIKYVNKVDTPSADDFNNVIESQLYSQNFAESIADTPDTSEASQVGVPSVTLINNIKNGVAYKKFKFANMKGDSGAVNGNFLNAVGTSTINGYSQAQTNKLLANPTILSNGDFFRNDNGIAVYSSPVASCINHFGFGLNVGTTGSYTVATRTLKSDTFETAGKYAFLYQYIDNPARLNGKVVTLSGKAASTTGNFVLQLWKTSGGTVTSLGKTAINRTLSKSLSVTIPSDEFAEGDKLRVIFQTYGETVLDYIKLEIGSLATAYTPEQAFVSTNSPETITGVKTFTASPIVPTTPSGPSAAVSKSYVDGLSLSPSPYDKVIRTQTEFNALIGSETWLGATSVALVGQFTLSTANNSGVKIPATVKQIHGFNSAKITITNFKYDAGSAKGGLWYDTAPTTQDYSIRDLEVSCTGTNGNGFFNCNNLSNCTGTGTGTNGNGYGFVYCNNLSNCTGTGTGANARGFVYCNNLSNCTGTGTGTTSGYGFFYIDYAVNCKDGGSSTAMWGGDNTNIDLDTCRKTPKTADKTELNA